MLQQLSSVDLRTARARRAAGLPVGGKHGSAKTDPIFKLLEQYEPARAAYAKASMASAAHDSAAANRALTRTAEKLSGLEWKIADTVPTTPDGLMLLLAYIERRSDFSDGNHPELGEDDSYSISGCQTAALMRSISAAVAKLAARP